MKLKSLLPLAVVLAGCSHAADPKIAAAPDAGISADQKIEQIKNDSSTPDGLKQIQMETLQHQPGSKR